VLQESQCTLNVGDAASGVQQRQYGRRAWLTNRWEMVLNVLRGGESLKQFLPWQLDFVIAHRVTHL